MKVYTNSIDENLYATLDRALLVYGLAIVDGAIQPVIAGNDLSTDYVYVDSDNFWNGRDLNGRMEFDCISKTAPLFGCPSRTIEYIGFSQVIV